MNQKYDDRAWGVLDGLNYAYKQIKNIEKKTVIKIAAFYSETAWNEIFWVNHTINTH